MMCLGRKAGFLLHDRTATYALKAIFLL